MRAAVAALSAAIVAALCLAVASSPATAQTATPQAPGTARLDIRQFGWQSDGTLSSASWNPVGVRVTGNGDANGPARVQVVLRANVGSSSQPSLYPVSAYGQEVALPGGVEKDVRIWTYVPSEGSYVGQVQLLSASGQVLAESAAQGQAARADIPLLGTLADSSTLAAQLGRIEVPYQQGLNAQVRTIEIAATDMPPRAEYLQAFRGLVVQGSAASSLTGEQRRAVQDWVVQGGHLLIAGGPDANRAASVLDGSSAPPMRFGSVDGATDLSALASWTSPGLTLSAGSAARIEANAGETLAGSTQPLAQRAPWGQGSVTLLATDPTLEPLRGWATTPMLLRRALEPALVSERSGADLTRGPAERADDLRLVSAVDALPPQVFPDWQQVALLLGVFALLAGPVLHLVLWRADRRPWLWVAVPALSVGFTVAIYLIAGAVPGRDVVANAVSEVRLDPRTGDARQAVAVGFFAPLRDRLTVRSSGELPVRVWMGSTPNLQQAASSSVGSPFAQTFGMPIPTATPDAPYRVVTGRDTQIEFGPMASAQNGLRSVVFSRALPAMGRIETDLHIEGPDGLIRGTVRNSTPYPLDQVGVGIGQTLVKLGPLAPGQTVPVSFDPRTTPPAAPAGVAYSLAWQMFGTPSTSARATQSVATLELPSDPEVRRRVRLLDTVLARGDRGRGAYSSGSQPYQQSAPTPPLLIAMSSALIGEDALPSAGAQRTYELSVLDQPVQLPVAPGPFKVVPVLLPPTIAADPGVTMSNNFYPGSSNGPAWVDLRGGAATYTFHADLPAGSRVDSLGIRTTQSSTQVTTPQSVSGPGLASISRGPDVPAPGTGGTFRAFNWQTNAWEPLTSGATETTLSPGGPFVSPSGVVRVQVNSGGRDRTLRYQAPELTVVGEAAAP